MKAIVQRVLSASVTVDSQVVSSISNGLLVFAAIAPDDTTQDIQTMANRITNLRVWDDADGKTWKRSVVDMDYQILMVSQFTLLAKTSKGNKPDFHGACSPEKAKEMYQSLVEKTREVYVTAKRVDKDAGVKLVQDGVFQAMMQVALVNDGPVTLEINTPTKQQPTVSQQKTKKVPKPKAPRNGTEKASLTQEITTKIEDIAISKPE